MSPSLRDLLDAPARVVEIPPAEAAAMLATLAAVQLALAARLATPAEQEPSASDELLSVEQAAAILGVDREWLWRRSRRRDFAAFTVKLSRKTMRFRRGPLLAWIARQGGGR